VKDGHVRFDADKREMRCEVCGRMQAYGFYLSPATWNRKMEIFGVEHQGCAKADGVRREDPCLKRSTAF